MSDDHAQMLVDLVKDFDGMVPGDHLLRMAERMGLASDADAWEVVRKRLLGESAVHDACKERCFLIACNEGAKQNAQLLAKLIDNL